MLAANLLISGTSNTFRGGPRPRSHSRRRVTAEDLEDSVRLPGTRGGASDGSGERGGDYSARVTDAMPQASHGCYGPGLDAALAWTTVC